MDDYLRSRNVTEEEIRKMKDEKITEETIDLMTDDELKAFLPKYGDRLALRSYLAKKKNPKAAEKMSLLEKLRLKINKRKRENDDITVQNASDKDQTSNISSTGAAQNALKSFRRIEVGLMLFDKKRGKYSQVKAPKGGGVRILKVAKVSSKDEIMKQAVGVFLNGKPEAFGKAEDYHSDLMDIKENIVPDGISLINIIDVTKLQRIKFYLAIRAKDTDEVESVSADSQPSSSQGPIPGVNESGMDESALAAANITASSSSSSIFDLQPNISAADILGTNDILSTLSERSIEVGANQEINGSINDRNVVFEDSVGEIQFLSQSHNYFGAAGFDITNFQTDLQQPNPTSVNDLTNRNNGLEEVVIKVHRGHIFNELKDYFKGNVDFSKQSLKLEIFLPNGQKEAAEDSGGVLRDALSEFWEAFYDKCTLGDSVKVPQLRHDFNTYDWVAVAKIFIFGWNQQRYFPVGLSKAFMSYCIYGVDSFSSTPDQLIEEFKRFIPKAEKRIVDNALTGEFDEDDVVDMLSAHECRVIPNKETFPKVLGEIAHKELIQEPTFIKDCWYDCIKEETFNFDQNLNDIYEKLIPTPRKVAEAFLFPENMTAGEQDTAKHLKRYVRSLEAEKLASFLRFSTGADILCIDVSGNIRCIQIRFNKLSGLARRPIAHTCGRVLELPANYDDFLQFKTEFNEVLNSKVWVMDFV